MTNSKIKSDSLKLVSLNVRGLSNFRKRRAIFTWCRKQKADLIFLQETHSTKAGEYKWKKEWGSEIIFSHGSSNARGVAVLIKRGLDIVVEQELLNSNGRSIILKTLIKDKRYLLANIYGPNKDAEAVRFYQNLSATLRKMDPNSDDNIVVGGDFNCPLNPTLDKKGGILIPRQHVINSIENVQNEFSLHDIWRIKNPDTRSFTWSKNHPFIFCRLDYWLISDKLNDLVTQVDIQASIKTDHSSIILELEDIKEGPRGPGFWKLNTSLLARSDYVEMINKEFPNWLKDAKDLSDKRVKWDWLKFKIKTSSIAYSKKLSRDRKSKEEELNLKYQALLKIFQDNPCETTRLETEKVKSELEALYDKKVEGIIIRSRARWHEHGEKNSKYFLNLVQYADDLTVFVPDIENVQRIFNLLDQFKTCSGLQVNYKKTEAMWIGSCRNNTAAPLGLTWVNTVKALGIVFTYNEIERLQKNFYDKLKDIRLQIRLWRCRGLSLLGKIIIIKSFLSNIELRNTLLLKIIQGKNFRLSGYYIDGTYI